MLFNLDFANNTILSCFFFFFFLIIGLNFLIPAVIAKILKLIADTTKEAKAETEIHPVVVEPKIRKCPI